MKCSTENKLLHQDNVCVAWLWASDEQRAAVQAFASQPLQSASIPIMTVEAASQPLQSHIMPETASVAYPPCHPHPYFNAYPYANSHKTVLNQNASSSQPASYIPRPNTYSYGPYQIPLLYAPQLIYFIHTSVIFISKTHSLLQCSL
jgi:hypothetical protein